MVASRGLGRNERDKGWKELSVVFSCSAFVWYCLAILCYSNHTIRYKAAGSCPPAPSLCSLSCIINHFNKVLANWNQRRWNWNVHRHLTILRFQEISCPLCCCCLAKDCARKGQHFHQNCGAALQEVYDVVSLSHAFSFLLCLTASCNHLTALWSLL